MPSKNLRVDAAPTARRATHVSLPFDLDAEAKGRGISISRACEDGLARAVKEDREAKSVEEHREYFNFWNEWVDRNGLPLAEHRQF